MKKESFFILAIMIWGLGMIIRAFFGGWSEQDNPIQDSSTWIIAELTNTWTHNIDSWNNVDLWNDDRNVVQPITKKEYTEIRIMMPRYFYTAWRKTFAENLYMNQKVYMKFVFIDDLNEYRDSLSNPDFSWADLMLFPYDWTDNIKIRSFSFQQSIQSVFDPLVAPLVNDKETKFLPFAADPMIMYLASGYSLQNNFIEISDFVYNRNSKKPRSFPLFFGITSEDYDSEWFSREYQDIVRYALMHYFTTYRDSTSLWKRIDSNVFENYKVADLKNIANAITIPKCSKFPSICFQIYDFVGLRFGFMSDADIVNQYFWKKADFDNITKMKMPFSSIESPVRLRWLAMPATLKDTETINAVYAFLIQYMNYYSKYDLRGTTLSVFTNEWDRLWNNEWIWLRWYILQTWGNYLQEIRNIRSFRQLLEYQISAREYMKRI